MKKILLTLALIFTLFSYAEAPGFRITKLYVRITAYSIYEKGESKWTSQGKRLKGETVCAVIKGSFPMGTRFYIPLTREYRIVGDTLPLKSARKHIKIAQKKGINLNGVIDLHYDKSLKSRAKSKGITKELRQKDLGCQIVEVYN